MDGGLVTDLPVEPFRVLPGELRAVHGNYFVPRVTYGTCALRVAARDLDSIAGSESGKGLSLLTGRSAGSGDHIETPMNWR